MRRTVFLASLLILLTAGFAAAVTFSSKFYSTPGPGTGVISGDFNRDGRPDLAVGNGQSDPSRITIFLGTGGGGFGAGVDYIVSSEPSKILTADLNGDGALDLIFDHGQASASPTNVISVLLGNGDGTFRPGTDLVMPFVVSDFDLGDFNNNGTIDVAVIDCDGSGLCYMQAEMNSGAGTFAPGWKIQMTGQAHSISARDLTGDGNLDLVLIRTTDVLLFGGNAAGEFRTFYKLTPPKGCSATCGKAASARC